MKTILRFFVLLILPLFFLTACGEKQDVPTLDERFGSEKSLEESFEGFLDKLKLDVHQKGTHQLTTEGGAVIYLQSSSIDLNDYVGQEVEVFGEVREVVGSREPVFSVASIVYLNEPSEVEWLSYEDQALGLAFEHPSTWIPSPLANRITFDLEEDTLVEITAISGQNNLELYAASQESSAPVEVTVAEQRAIRYVSGSNLLFYVLNPPKEIIYKIEFLPSRDLIESGEDQVQQALFYDMLRSVSLIYVAEFEGEMCGGEPFLECAEDFVCQLNDGSNFATGVCVPVDGTGDLSQCPFMARPDCSEYRISDYNARGCPSRYECVNGVSELEVEGTDFDPDFENDLGEFVTSIEYEVPPVSSVTQSFVSENGGFELSSPKSWYFVSFGPTENHLWTMGFLNEEFEALDEALVTLNVENSSGGMVSRKVGDVYYNFTGPSDLEGVMEAMANSVEEVEGE